MIETLGPSRLGIFSRHSKILVKHWNNVVLKRLHIATHGEIKKRATCKPKALKQNYKPGASQWGNQTFLPQVSGIFFATGFRYLFLPQVARTIRQHNADIQDSLQSGGRISVEEIKITKTLFALVLGFALCWVPSFSIVVLVRIILSYTPHGVAFVAGYLLSLSSAINPFIYGAMNRPFRREFREILRCGRECSVGPETSSTRSTMVSRSGRNWWV